MTSAELYPEQRTPTEALQSPSLSLGHQGGSDTLRMTVDSQNIDSTLESSPSPAPSASEEGAVEVKQTNDTTNQDVQEQTLKSEISNEDASSPNEAEGTPADPLESSTEAGDQTLPHRPSMGGPVMD